MGRPLVVESPRLGRRPHRERTAGNQHLGRKPEHIAGRRAGRRSAQHRPALAKLVRGQHGLVVLLLVLGDHAEHEAAVDELPAGEADPLKQVENPSPDVAGVAAGLGGRQQRQRRPRGTRMLERVVERIDLRVHRVAAADVAQQPELLLISDVGEIPDQR